MNFVRDTASCETEIGFDGAEDFGLDGEHEVSDAEAKGDVFGARHAARGGARDEGRPIIAAITRLAEAATVTLTTFAVAFACHAAVPEEGRAIAVAGFATMLTFCLLHQVFWRATPGVVGGYGHQVKRLLQLVPILLCSAMAGTVVIALTGDARPQLMTTLSIWMATSAVALLAVGTAGSYALRRPSVAHRIARKVAVIGHDGHALRAADCVAGGDDRPVRLLGIFSDEPPHPGVMRDRMAVSGSIDALIELTRETAIDDIVIAVPPDADASETVAQLRWRLRGVSVEVYIMPNLARADDSGLPVERLGSLALVAVQRRPLTQAQAIRKRLIDIAFGMILLFLLVPVLVAVAVAIKLDSPGPVLFRQPRLGFNDRPFTVLKFRSMYANASDLMASRQTSRRDPRVTRIGKWLRKLSLDELPQLFNVLSGDMSLVGPRPHAPHTRAGGQLLKDAMAEYVIRHQVRPGITGWAQVNGARGELVTTDDLRRRVTYDLEYIQKWSIWFDLRIISMTVMREVFSKHAF